MPKTERYRMEKKTPLKKSSSQNEKTARAKTGDSRGLKNPMLGKKQKEQPGREDRPSRGVK